MQPVDNDMDDLFRKAAEDYPLNTEGADWNKLLQKMEGENAVPPAKQRGGKGRLLWLLLLLPMFFICNRYSNDNIGLNPSTRRQTGETDIAAKKSTIDQKGPPSADDRNDAYLKEKNLVPKEGTIDEVSLNGEKQEHNDLNSDVREFRSNEVRSSTSLVKNKKSALSKRKLETSVTGKSISKSRRNKSATTSLLQEGATVAATNKGTDFNNSTVSETMDKQDLTKLNTTGKNGSDVAKAEVAKKDSVQTNPNSAKSNPASKYKKLYWGIIGGPDFSTVKSSKVQDVGFGYGLLAGYRITEKLAVETGVLWGKKEYQSDGEYFKTDKAGWPVHTNVIDIAGYCEMFEVPLNIRYDFASRKSSLWFATAGLSSYFMKNENYHYTVERYGQQYSGNKEYKNSSSDVFSVANLSVGYQTQLGKIGSLRVEPYVKLPLKGVGIGSLPLRSTGVYFGITRPIR